MNNSKLSERLRFDMKFLLWRAEVYQLQLEEVESRFREINDEYLSLAQGEQSTHIARELSEWHLILSHLAHPAQSA